MSKIDIRLLPDDLLQKIADMEVKLNTILKILSDSANTASNSDIDAMLEAVFTGKTDGSDIEDDEVILMLDDVFAGEEQLNDGDTDEDFITTLDEVFNS